MTIDRFEGKYFFLSNFYPSPFVFKEGEDEFVAKTVEHYYQYMKTPSLEEGIGILEADTPAEAKRLGRLSYLREDWEDIKVEVMMTALREKFAIPELREKLLATGDAHLIEGNNWHDNYWGICTCPKCTAKDIVGKNVLGRCLMKIREEIKNDT
jgi:ribA/ribD-fused uncharacterized protein